MTRTLFTVAALVGAALAAVGVAGANLDELLRGAAAPAAPTVSAESRFNDGLALAQKEDWRGAEGAFREAIQLRSEFPEAWNGLGHALRRQQRYDESVRSYQEALRLRPDYPQALEYLGEAYVQMQRIAEAQAVLERLRPLDPREAAELAEAIAKAGK